MAKDASWKKKEKFLFGEEGELLFSDRDGSNDKSSKSSDKQKEPTLVLEKNFTRKPYA